MYITQIHTKVSLHLHKLWIQEIHSIACDITQENNPNYIIYTNKSHDKIYLFFSEFQKNYILDNLTETFYALKCNPDIDLALTSFYNFTSIPIHYSIEDITLNKLIMYTKSTELMLYDKKIHNLALFLIDTNEDITLLQSYINQILIDNGHVKIYTSINPQIHTQLELESQLMLCNKELYVDYKESKIKTILDTIEQIEPSHRNKGKLEFLYSELIYEMMCNHVVVCDKKIWYFKKNVWEESTSDCYIWNFIIKNIIEKYNTINKILMSCSFRSLIIKDVKLRLHDDNFIFRLDSKPHIIFMKNGILNVKTLTLRDPVPSDYVLKKTNIPYHIFDMQSSQYQQLFDILQTIFPQKKILNFFILTCCTFFEGYNNSKKFHIWWGEGNNAKSLIQTLIQKTFGDYCTTAPTSLVTSKRTGSSNATPELCQLDNKLIVFLQEPNMEEKLKVGIIKELTGNDTMYARQLYSTARNMNIKAKFIMVCNNILEIPGMDSAIRRRLVVLPFLSTFLDENEYQKKIQTHNINKYCKLIDKNIEKNLLDCTSVFMYVLCKRYYEWIHYENMEFTVPPIIEKTTEDYLTRNNFSLKFITRYISKNENENMLLADIYEAYKDWFKKLYPTKRIDDYEVFVKELSHEGYKENTDGYVPSISVSYNG